MTGARTIRQLPWRYRAVLALLPAHVRDEHERELAWAIAEEPADVSWGTLLVDVLRAAPRAHWEVLRQDLLVAVRQLQRAPGFALIAIVTLSLGLGGNLAFFTLVDRVLFQPLHLIGASEIVAVAEENIPRGMRNFGMSPANFRDYARDTALFEATGAYQVRSATLIAGDARERVVTAAVSGGFFQVFRERPIVGRALLPSDDVVGGNAVVVSHAFYQTVLGGDPSVIGRRIELDGKSLQIVGIMPPAFDFPSRQVALWRPLAMPESEWERRGARFVSMVARLRHGVTVAQGAARVSRQAAALSAAHPQTNTDWTVILRDLRASRVDGARAQLYLVLAAGTLVLLVAVANVAGLFMARAVTRQREFAVRSALGARSGRVARQVTTEALLLTVVSTGLGLVLAAGVLQWIRIAGGGALPRIEEAVLGWRTVAVAFVLAVLSAMALGLLAIPSLRTHDVWGKLGSARGGASRGRWRLHRALVVGEVAFAAFVLIGASLVARTLWTLLHQPLGFEASGVATFRVEPPFRVNLDLPAEQLIPALEADRRRVAPGYDALFAAIRALPGVESVGAINRLPLTGGYWVTSVGVPDRPSSSDNGRYHAWIRPVSSGYLQTMRTRLTRGRALAPSDAADGERVVVVDEAFARKVWGDDDPIGKELVLDGPPGRDIHARIVGVAESVHMNRLDAEQAGTMYIPLGQALEGFFPNWGMDIVVRGVNVSQQTGEFRRLSRTYFPDAVAFGEASMESLVAASVADRRFHLLVLGVFGALALVLAAVGVGGALMLAVRERRSELAVRVALGARLGRVWWEVMAGGLVVTLRGVAIGTGVALAGAQLFSSLVYGIAVRDPLSYIMAPVVLALAAFVAVAVPATRAIRVNPTAVLRES